MRIVVWILLLAGICLPAAIHAHFKLNLNIRIFHVSPQLEGLDLYLRLPMPYLVADLVGEEQDDGSLPAAPFTSNAKIDGEWMHYIDYQAIQDDAVGLGVLAADGHTITSNGVELTPLVKSVRVYTGDSQPPFSTLEEAQASFENLQETQTPVPFVGDTVADVLIQYRPGRSITSYEISSSLNPGLEGQEETANLIVDHADNDPRIFRIRGLLTHPVEISRSAWQAARTFVVEGVRHILGGYDHVLFVVCLVMGAATFVTLAWRVTGFTLGHSVTLTLGFFGYVPAALWFVPLVETGIALSIIVAALMALSSSTQSTDLATAAASNTNGSFAIGGFVVTALIGMLHGLGFSFVLHEILGVTSSNIWISLLSFNVGVELGQLGIVVLIWPILFLLGKFLPAWLTKLRWLILLPCIGVAAYWCGERLISLLSVL